MAAVAAYPSPPNHNSPPGRKASTTSLYEKTAMASQPGQAYGGAGGADQSPLSTLNINFLKTLTDKRTTRDGQPAKRRGPKPDSKPALTRRQELNRQAQRTHRERKELYIKALEDEVLRLKEIYSNISHDKERLTEENKQLKQLITQNPAMAGALPGGSLLDDNTSNPSGGYSGSISGSFVPPAPSSNTSAYTPPPMSAAVMGGQQGASPQASGRSHSHGHEHNHGHGHGHGHRHAQGQAAGQQRNPNIDYEQAGIDFVLTLEKPCMDHMPWLLERGAETGGEACGHALMASCPPEPFPELTPDIPFGYTNVRNGDTETGQRTWELSKGDLATLLALSSKLNLDGEITPVMAWGMVLGHPRLNELLPSDFQKLSEELVTKIRCYGFGAVMEEFEVRDALEGVLSTKCDAFSPAAKQEFVMAY